MQTQSSQTVGVVLGRFQLSEIHNGHAEVIAEVQKRHQKVVLMVATTPTVFNQKNPLPGELRVALLQKEFEFQDVIVLELKNNQSDTEWSSDFDRLLEGCVGSVGCVIYGARDNSLKHYEGKHQTCELPLDLPISATTIRRKEGKAYPDQKKDLQNFAKGVIYTTQNLFPVSYTAVDLAVLRWHITEPRGSSVAWAAREKGTLQILLCRKKKDVANKWRFCGGFVDPADKTILAAVKREGAEELGINFAVDGFQFLGDTLINDWRYRGTEHSIRTMFHVAWYQWGTPKAGDDICQTEWFPVKDIENIILDEHKPLADMLITYVKTLGD